MATLGPDDLPPPPPPDDLDKIISDPDTLALARERHPLNCLITEFNWQRLSEVARLDELDSVSAVVRMAIDKFLDEHPGAEHLLNVALIELETEVERRKNRGQ